MAKPFSNRRLFAEDGYTFLRWITDEEVGILREEDQIEKCLDPRSDRILGFKLKKTPEQLRDTASLLPFSRPTRPEDKFRYEVPHAGDCRSICLRRYSLRHFVSEDKKVTIGRRIIKVSARKIDFTALAFRRTLQSASNLSA